MQAAGVPAGAVQNCKGLFEDPQVKHRRGFAFLHHKVMGLRAYNTPAFRLSMSPWQPKKAPAAMGEDNEWVYKEILGFSDAEIAGLVSEGVITTETDVP
jgi:crotonobetainyl-CoA:carnitine CoA-transferase CaiB-like acyl-CoA transferase